ncbi:MAG: ferredoxin [Candidatus Dependentiae bacterium]
MKKVTIEPGCTSCGLCEFIAPEIFEVKDVSCVKPQASLQEHVDAIKQAAIGCPVQVIVIEE